VTPSPFLPLQAHQEILKQLVDLIGTTSIMEVQYIAVQYSAVQ